jgi:hypothetical protein
MILNMVSGGKLALNFSVVAYAQESALPSTANANTIAIITDTSITSYTFSATAPTSPTAGMVWIIIGSKSMTPFNALTSNQLTVYPISAMQYISGAWVSKTAKIYQSGWKSWFDGWLFNNGETYNDITCGWKNFSSGTKLSGDAYNEASFGEWYCTVNKINLSGFNKLNVKFTKIQGCATIAINDDNYKPSLASDLVAYAQRSSAGTCSLDISGYEGEYNVFVIVGPKNSASGYTYATASASQVWLSVS